MADNTVRLILKDLVLIPCEYMIESVTALKTTIALLYEEICLKVDVDKWDRDAHLVCISATYPLRKVDADLYRALNDQRFVSLCMGLSVFEHGSELHFMYKLPEWIPDQAVGTACRHGIADLAFAIRFWRDIVYSQSCGEPFKIDTLPIAALKDKLKRRAAFKDAIHALPTLEAGSNADNRTQTG